MLLNTSTQSHTLVRLTRCQVMDQPIVQIGWSHFPRVHTLGARLRGRTATQCSKIRVLRRFWGRVMGKGACCGFYSKKRVLRTVLRRGSEKGVSRRCPERPLEGYALLGVRPNTELPTLKNLEKSEVETCHLVSQASQAQQKLY